jgi:geranylgeranyl pyrophosphate synthase
MPQMEAVDAEIDRVITTPVKLIADVAAHTLGAGGKRLRPALVILAAQLCGDSSESADVRAVTCAAAVELLHTTSLIHDDVVDSAATRRGKPAANLVWGNQTSILVGDYLVAQVFVTVSQRGFHNLLAPMAHATSQLCAGELLETQTRGLLSMSEEQYCDIIAMKTAALTECACRLGAMVMDATDEQVEKLARYGREIGMAFQIVDDVFDIVASEGRVGKPVGNDIREGDITLPMLRAMETCSEAEREELRAIVGREGFTTPEVQRALQIIRDSDGVSHSLAMAANYVASAKAQLADFAPSAARDMLCDVADYVLSRDR